MHSLIGSGTVGRGNKGSGLDIGNLLKPSLGRGEIQVIISQNNAFLLDCYNSHARVQKRKPQMHIVVWRDHTELCDKDNHFLLLTIFSP